jgi:membrane-associated phospholipid phosphatase
MHDLLWSLIPWGYQILLALEALRSPALNVFFAFITDVGGEFGYLALLTTVYWCIDKTVGQGMAYAYLLTATLNTWLKDLWRIPRPHRPEIEPQLEAAGIEARLTSLRHLDSPAFPSGHTQGAFTGWGYLAARFRRRWLWVVAPVMAILIGFSRMYLGVHFPQDVLVGACVGVLYLVAWLWIEPRLRAWSRQMPPARRYLVTTALPLTVLLLHPVEGTATALGALLGLGIGFVLETETLRFSVAGTWQQRVLRALIGLFAIFVTYFSLSALFGLFDERTGEILALVWRTLRYGLVGFIGAWGVPWLLIKFGLMERDTASTP